MVECQWRALCTKITEVNLSEFVYRLFHEDFSPLIIRSAYFFYFNDTHSVDLTEYRQILCFATFLLKFTF